ncbi:MAG: hypothetical protein RQ866_05030, partial [Bacteroidales bacterium]|nr:hypothetical protein [Bacteroidales bacterium]
MALTLQKSPAVVSLAGNDILFKINTDNQYSSLGSKANLGMQWASGDANGNSFTLAWGNNEIVFTCDTTPDDSGTQYPPYASGTMDAYMESLVDYFKSNYLLSQDFIVSWNNAFSVVQVQARATGTAYSLTLTPGSSNVTEDSNVAGTEKTKRDDYAIFCRVWQPGDGPEDYILLGTDRLDTDEDGNVRFRIQEYLKELTTPAYTYPEDPDKPIVEQAGMIARYFIEYAERYNDEVKKLFSTEETITRVIGGMVDSLKEKQYDELEMTFMDELQGAGMFLSWHPQVKTIGTWQPEKLYYLNVGQHATLKFRIKKYWTDNTATISLIETVVTTPDEIQMYEICCGHDQLQLNLAVKELSYYEIYVEDGDNNPVSEVRKFIVDPDYQEYEKVFFFRNSLDAYETLRTTGIHEKTNEFEHNLVEKMVLTGDLLYSLQSNDESWMQEAFTGNSGWISKEELHWTNEFIISRERYLVENYRMIPVLVTSTKVFQHKDDDRLYAIEFEYRIPLSEKAYSNRQSIDLLMDETGDPITTESGEYIWI